jgi:hypothetical protein
MPEPLYTEFTKITSTADPSRKMSKSAGEKHYISLFAESDKIRKQVRSAVTDTGENTSGEMSAGVKNLFELLKACGKMETFSTLKADYDAGVLKYAPLKEAVAEALVEVSETARNKRIELNTRKKEVKEEIKASSKKPKSSKSSGGVRIITNILEIGSSLKDVLLNAVDASSSIPSDMLACDSGSNEHVANQLRDDVYNVQPIKNTQAKMANKSTLSLRATYDTGIKGFGTFYVANNGTMPRSLTSVGRTADEGMMSIFDGENVYILHEGEQIDLKRDQIAYMVPRDKKTGLYMCPYAEFMTPASVKFAQQDRQKKAPACKIPASDPTSDSDGEEA